MTSEQRDERLKARLQKAKDFLRTPAHFRAWLKRFGAGVTVGHLEGQGACPVARFLRANGFRGIEVGNEALYLKSGRYQVEIENHPWVEAFVAYVDAPYDERLNVARRSPKTGRARRALMRVSASEALEALRNSQSMLRASSCVNN